MKTAIIKTSEGKEVEIKWTKQVREVFNTYSKGLVAMSRREVNTVHIVPCDVAKAMTNGEDLKNYPEVDRGTIVYLYNKGAISFETNYCPEDRVNVNIYRLHF